MTTTTARTSDLLVFSHLRWDFVFQRPQHLMTRCARHRTVHFVEEPRFSDGIRAHLDVTQRGERLRVVVPRLPHGLNSAETDAQLKKLLDDYIARQVRASFISWYYTPMAIKFTRHLAPAAVVYDCMDELSQFKAAPPELTALEAELFGMADIVFTGGVSLYEHKRSRHSNVHPFPSSVDVSHFVKARAQQSEPHDQAVIGRPRIGFAGVIDERFDVELISGVAQARPDWQFVIVGPVVKIDPDTLPRGRNLHYLGAKPYEDLPAYFSGWDVALLPFARNEATRFISPTKTPEYLAAGRPVVSTSIRDVVRGYADTGLVRIADDPHTCIAAIASAMEDRKAGVAWLDRVDALLSQSSWDRTFRAMWGLVEAAMQERRAERDARRRLPYSAPLTSGADTRAFGLPGARTS